MMAVLIGLTGGAYAEEWCAQPAIGTIGLLKEKLTPRGSAYDILPQVDSIITLADDCKDAKVRLAVVDALGAVVNEYTWDAQIASAVAEKTAGLCGSDSACALKLIGTLANGLDPARRTECLTTAAAIVKIADAAPTADVKETAVTALNKGLTGDDIDLEKTLMSYQNQIFKMD